MILIRLFALKHAVPQIVGTGEPLVLYEPVDISVGVPVVPPQADESADSSRDGEAALLSVNARLSSQLRSECVECSPSSPAAGACASSPSQSAAHADRDLRTARI